MDSREIASHYSRSALFARLSAALEQDGVDPHRPSIESLAPYDQFHGRGLEATKDVAELMPARAGDHVLDIGSGIGGPARYFAWYFGCRVTGIDLTAEFCEVARQLTRLLGMEERVRFELGDALAMPFADARFEGAYSMNVSMNIVDKGGFYREIRRVLKPGGWLVLSEIAKVEGGGELRYPTAWAASERTSFLATPADTRRGLAEAGFEVLRMEDTLAATLEFGSRSRAMVERGEKPPHRAVALIHGDLAPEAAANTARGLKDGAILPIEVLARSRA